MTRGIKSSGRTLFGGVRCPSRYVLSNLTTASPHVSTCGVHFTTFLTGRPGSCGINGCGVCLVFSVTSRMPVVTWPLKLQYNTLAEFRRHHALRMVPRCSRPPPSIRCPCCFPVCPCIRESDMLLRPKCIRGIACQEKSDVVYTCSSIGRNCGHGASVQICHRGCVSTPTPSTY